MSVVLSDTGRVHALNRPRIRAVWAGHYIPQTINRSHVDIVTCDACVNVCGVNLAADKDVGEEHAAVGRVELALDRRSQTRLDVLHDVRTNGSIIHHIIKSIADKAV